MGDKRFRSIEAKRVPSPDPRNASDLLPGDFYWTDLDTDWPDLTFRLPGDEWGFIRTIQCYREGVDKPGDPSWQWDGNEDVPTLTPSIRSKGAPDGKTTVWHGYLTEGRFEACE